MNYTFTPINKNEYSISYRNKEIGSIFLDKTNSIKIDDVCYIHFRSQPIATGINFEIIDFGNNISNFLYLILSDTEILKEFINQSPFITFNDFSQFFTLLKEFAVKRLNETNSIYYHSYLNVLENGR